MRQGKIKRVGIEKNKTKKEEIKCRFKTLGSEATMKILHKTQTTALYYLLHTGFQSFKERIKDELTSTSGINLEDIMDDSNLYAYYQQGESADFVAACISANC